MKRAGLLAHSPDGAALCFTEFCHLGSERMGNHLHPDIVLDYAAMGKSLPAWDAGDIAFVRGILARGVERLAAAGAEFFFCPDNTAHIALELEGEPLALPGLNIADVLSQEAAEHGLRKIALLGTRYTMNGPVYPRALGSAGLDWAVPDPEEQTELNRIIFDELVAGRTTEASRDYYCGVINRLKAAGCDGVALVCTEIPLLISQEDSSLPILDSTRLMACAALDVAMDRVDPPRWRGGPIP